MKLKELKDKKILILGLGKEGMDNFRFLEKIFPEKVLGLADQSKFEKLSERAKKNLYHLFGPGKRHKIKLHLGQNYLKKIKDYQVIIKSPGIPPKKIAPFVSKDQRVTSQTEIFLESCLGKIVGVTGTKGKSTTASLIYKILKQGGLKAHLIGNIGKPISNLLFKATPKDICVYELSSHQLYNLKKSPQIAVFLNIYPDHLDYYRNFKEYLKAKFNITKHQTEKDYLIFNSKHKIVKEIAKKSKAKKIPLTRYSNFISSNLGKRKIPLKGDFNVENVKAAIAVGKILGILPEDINQAIKNFKPLSHRLEYIGKYHQIKFYNDALSTIPETTIAALNTLGNDVETILLGGFDRKLNFKNLAKRILKSEIKNLIFFPTTGQKIWQEITQLSKSGPERFRYFFVNNMPEAIKFSYQYTGQGKICLLSCASPSFSIFRDYKQKGNLFKKYVKKYAQR